MSVLTLSPHAVVLGKRKALESPVRRPTQYLSPSPRPSFDSDSGSEDNGDDDASSEYTSEATEELDESPARPSSSLSSRPVSVSRLKKYECSYEGCEKSYTKPSRLAEHERSHTGDRPYACPSCSKSYLRESHLQAHARSHLSASDRPLGCTHATCEKRFWTQQHLDAHIRSLHEGVKPFACSSLDCSESFAKHNQLRAHFAAAHCTPGTKPFRCEHEGCMKSFSTSQKLRTHSKVHQRDRYTCAQPSCLHSSPASTSTSMVTPTYFSTWTELQHHLRTVHPPECPYPECNKQTFTAQKGLRVHLKIHEDRAREREADDGVLAVSSTSALGESGEGSHEGEGEDERREERQPKRRRGGEVGRDWACSVDKCEKAFKSKNALTNHVTITHLGHRPFSCPEDGCQKTFGYRHVMQRHVAQKHLRASPLPAQEVGEEQIEGDDRHTLDLLTGRHYDNTNHPLTVRRSGGTGDNSNRSRTNESPVQTQTRRRARRMRVIACPWPDAFSTDAFFGPLSSASSSSTLTLTSASPSAIRTATTVSGGGRCAFKFSRAYDLARHLRSEHSIDVEHGIVEEWVGRGAS